jgi:sugar lactone lactonase YvrE
VSTEHLEAVLRVDAHAELGEGPSWDPATGDLLWVDILGRRVHRFDVAQGSPRSGLVTDGDVGAVVPRRNGGLVLALPGAFALLEPGASAPATTILVEADRPETRMNDGKCDQVGRFWAGTMAYAGTPSVGALYRLDPDLSVTMMLDSVTCSNGLGWSPDGRTMYYIDTGTRGVDAFAFDPATGAIANRQRVIDIPADLGEPDGMSVDIEGGVWVALWGGGAVRRYLPNGTLDRIVELPCQLVTSCAFAGEGLDELFITTASVGLTSEELHAQPTAGGLFSCRPGVANVKRK